MPTIELSIRSNKIYVKPDSLQVLAGGSVSFKNMSDKDFEVAVHNYEPFFQGGVRAICDKISSGGEKNYDVALNPPYPVKYYSVCVQGFESNTTPPDAPPRIIITPAVWFWLHS